MQNPLPNVQEIPPPTLTPTKVLNERPSVEVPYRLAIIGEAPGADEEAYGRPFIGASGRLLDSILNGVGLLRAGCFVGNVCQYRPPGNKIKNFGYDHPKVREGWAELKDQLNEYKPNCILALGNTPLHFLCGRSGITSWRGSILSSPFGKIVPSIHPAAILRDYKLWPLLRFDALRARK
jgi:uracil-DNA glycosylase